MLTADKANTLIVGRGVQGKKRREICGDDFVGFVDPFDTEAEFNTIHQVDLNAYDRVLGCVPDEPKLDLVRFCIFYIIRFIRKGFFCIFCRFS